MGTPSTGLPAGTDSGGDHRRPPSTGRLLLASGGARLLMLPIGGLSSILIARLVTTADGVDLFGVVMLIATLSQLLMFADLGAGAAIATARAQVQNAPSEVEKFRRTNLTAIRTTLWSAALLALVACLIGLFGAWPALLGVSNPNLSTGLNVAAVLTLVTFGLALPFSLAQHVLRGSGRMHQAIVLTGLSAPFALVLTGALYVLDAPALSYALTLPIGALLSAICCTVQVARTDRKLVTGIMSEVLRPRRFPGLPISATAAPWFVVMIGLPLALQSDRIIISHQTDAVSLADYSYAAQLYAPLFSVMSLAALALWPSFAADNLTDGAARRSWLTGVGILGAAGSVGAVGFVLLSPYVISWMSAGTASPEWSLLFAFAALLVVQSLHATSGMVLISPRHLKFQAVCVIALVVTNIPASWVLAPILGPAGPVWASVLTVAVCQLVPGAILAHRVTDHRSASKGRADG
ncbi:lipopolysaccharide biosynthesis protein [Mycobacterium sp. E740]|uniref:lipopolysaccharide biosynthesis protein n=1 Tax=Mycobacterium sp. E740 TaxID=1834149 RepID=UPI000801CDBE|nr:hypothetical protein [Mycobacterium sp. E740]OBI74853.1 hypothetical protein A5663_00415 [Mycobacterium sp. E740]